MRGNWRNEEVNKQGKEKRVTEKMMEVERKVMKYRKEGERTR